MDRNRWETAIRCLEVALHPNTSDDEVIAAVNAFRRTANGTPLGDVCIELAGGSHDGRGMVVWPVEWRQEFEWVNQENRNLRRKLEAADTSQIVADRRLHEAEQHIRNLTEEMLAAQGRANSAEQRLVDFRSAYAQISDDLNHENFNLRSALEQARRAATERQTEEAVPPFRKFLDVARLRTDQAETIMTHQPTALDLGRESSGSPIFGPSPHRPWTA